MSVALLLVTHKNIATSMMDVATSIIGDSPVNYACVEVPMDAPIDSIRAKIETSINQLDTSDGLLVLTDMYGGTPSNIAQQFVTGEETCLISGLNLPMLVRIMNYRDLSLAQLKDKCVIGGKQSIEQHEDEKD